MNVRNLTMEDVAAICRGPVLTGPTREEVPARPGVCRRCEGTGEEYQPTRTLDYVWFKVTCPDCGGSGEDR